MVVSQTASSYLRERGQAHTTLLPYVSFAFFVSQRQCFAVCFCFCFCLFDFHAHAHAHAHTHAHSPYKDAMAVVPIVLTHVLFLPSIAACFLIRDFPVLTACVGMAGLCTWALFQSAACLQYKTPRTAYTTMGILGIWVGMASLVLPARILEESYDFGTFCNDDGSSTDDNDDHFCANNMQAGFGMVLLVSGCVWILASILILLFAHVRLPRLLLLQQQQRRRRHEDGTEPVTERNHAEQKTVAAAAAAAGGATAANDSLETMEKGHNDRVVPTVVGPKFDKERFLIQEEGEPALRPAEVNGLHCFESNFDLMSELTQDEALVATAPEHELCNCRRCLRHRQRRQSRRRGAGAKDADQFLGSLEIVPEDVSTLGSDMGLRKEPVQQNRCAATDAQVVGSLEIVPEDVSTLGTDMSFLNNPEKHKKGKKKKPDSHSDSHVDGSGEAKEKKKKSSKKSSKSKKSSRDSANGLI